jgi:hypothetical protein
MPTFYNATRSPAVYDAGAPRPRWILGATYENYSIKIVEEDPIAGRVYTLTSLPANRSFAYRRDGSRSFIYYCDGDTGRLYRKQVEPTQQAAVALPWPVPTRGTQPTVQCRGTTMRFNPDREWEGGSTGTVMFSYEQYGLFGIAEYFDVLPP